MSREGHRGDVSMTNAEVPGDTSGAPYTAMFLHSRLGLDAGRPFFRRHSRTGPARLKRRPNEPAAKNEKPPAIFISRRIQTSILCPLTTSIIAVFRLLLYFSYLRQFWSV